MFPHEYVLLGLAWELEILVHQKLNLPGKSFHFFHFVLVCRGFSRKEIVLLFALFLLFSELLFIDPLAVSVAVSSSSVFPSADPKSSRSSWNKSPLLLLLLFRRTAAKDLEVES